MKMLAMFAAIAIAFAGAAVFMNTSATDAGEYESVELDQNILFFVKDSTAAQTIGVTATAGDTGDNQTMTVSVSPAGIVTAVFATEPVAGATSATVNVTPVTNAAGEAIVTVTAGSFSASCTVVVYEEAADIDAGDDIDDAKVGAFEIPVEIKNFPLPGNTKTIRMLSSNDSVIKDNTIGKTVKNNGTILFPVTALKAGETELTFIASQGSKAVSATISVKVISSLVVPERINLPATAGDFDLSVDVSGFAGATNAQISVARTAGNEEKEGGSIVPIITIPSAKVLAVDGKFTFEDVGITSAVEDGKWVLLTVSINDVTNPANPQLIASDDVMVMFDTYAAHADGAVKTYAEGVNGSDAVNSQAIFYSDGAALINLSKIDLKNNQNVNIDIEYTVSPDWEANPVVEYKYTTTFVTTAKAYLPIDLPYFIDFTQTGKTVITIKGFDDNATLTTITADRLPLYTLSLDINYENGSFNGGAVASPYTPAGDDLKRNADLKVTTIERDGYSFAGFAFQNDAKEGIAYDATQKIEWLVFTYGNGSSETTAVYNPTAHSIYAIWAKKIYNVYVDYDEANKIFIPGTKIDSDNGFKFTAPAIAYNDDYVLVRVAQIGALSENTYALKISEVLYDENTHEYSKGTEKTPSLNVKMLANGIYTFTNLTCDVVVEVTKAVSTQKMVGFGFDIQSAQTNDAGTKGKVMMQFDVRDIVPAGEITLKGTYFRVDSVTGQRVYGNIDNLDAATYFTTSVSKNFGEYSAAAAGSVVEIDDSAVDYSIQLGSTIGLYAVQGQYVNGATYTTGWTLAEKADL